MYDKIVFYNSFGNGDIFESREFVKAWMKMAPAKEYYYAHGKNPRILQDIPELKYTPVTEIMHSMKDIVPASGALYINTWIGRDGKYVLPGIGCTVEELYRMHNDILAKRNFGRLPGVPKDYIPDIDYSYYQLDGVQEFLSKHPEDKIFIDNGNVQSMQAENFPMDEIIYELSINFRDRAFIVTHELPIKLKNIYATKDITKVTDGFDLNEISYLSTFCSVLLGRNSGPHVFSQVRKNCDDETKKLISFTYQVTGASFVVNTDVKIQKYWSDATDKEDVIQALRAIL